MNLITQGVTAELQAAKAYIASLEAQLKQERGRSATLESLYRMAQHNNKSA